MLSAYPYGNSSSLRVQILKYICYFYILKDMHVYAEILLLLFHQQAKGVK